MVIKGNKVLLRDIELTDALNYVRWLNDPEINQYLAIDGGMTLEKEEEWIKSLPADKDKHVFAICTAEGQHIGSVELRVERHDKIASFGIFIGEKALQGKGYGKETMQLMLDYGFGKLDLHRIELLVHDDNEKARRLYENIGLQTEGLKRENVIKNGKFKNSYVMSILVNEWSKNASYYRNQKTLI